VARFEVGFFQGCYRRFATPGSVSTKFQGKRTMIVPPLVYIPILEANTLIPKDLIPLFSNKFQEFNRMSPSVKACTILRPVLEYLWAAHILIIAKTLYHGRIDCIWLTFYPQVLHLSYPLPPCYGSTTRAVSGKLNCQRAAFTSRRAR
jgi:hypothetical protein